MKKLIATSISLALAVALSGCGSEAAPVKTREPAPVPTTEQPVEPTTPEPPTEEPTTEEPTTEEPATEEPAESSDRRVHQLKEIVEQFFTEENYTYEYNDQHAYFRSLFNVDNSFQNAVMVVYLYSDRITVRAFPGEWDVPEEGRDRVAVYAALYNLENSYTVMDLDYNTGWISTRSMIYVEKALPTTAEVSVAFHEPLVRFEKHGDALLAVADGADPHETYANVEK